MLTVDLVTPSRKLIENVKASSITLPSRRGQIEILPGHAALITLLDTGAIAVQMDGQVRKFFLSHGFAEVRQDRVLVFGETVEDSDEINRQRAQLAQKKAEQALAGVLTESDFKKQQLKLERAIIRQHISM